MAPAEVAELVRHVGGALAAAHAKGVVHRDLKPSNVMLLDLPDEPIFAKLLDFGISQSPRDRGRHLTGEHEVLGTPHYMAPEQAASNHDLVDARTDQFALAVLIWEMLTGTRPFEGATTLKVLQKITHEAMPPLAGLWPSREADHVEAVLARAMCKRPEDRFSSIMEFVTEVIRPLARAQPVTMDTARDTETPAAPRTTQPFSSLEHLLVHLGGLGAIIHRTRTLVAADHAISTETAFIASLAEEGLTIGEVVAMSPLGDEATLSALDRLCHSGVIAIERALGAPDVA